MIRSTDSGSGPTSSLRAKKRYQEVEPLVDVYLTESAARLKAGMEPPSISEFVRGWANNMELVAAKAEHRFPMQSYADELYHYYSRPVMMLLVAKAIKVQSFWVRPEDHFELADAQREDLFGALPPDKHRNYWLWRATGYDHDEAMLAAPFGPPASPRTWQI